MSKIPHRLIRVDYYDRRIYHITMTVEGRRPILGTLVGDPAIPVGQPGAPEVKPSQLGAEVLRCLSAIPQYHPHCRLLAWQLMPDHLHFVLFVLDGSGPHLGRIILGFKQGCNKAYRLLFAAPPAPALPGAAVPEVAVPEVAVPGAAVPGAAVPEVAVPEVAIVSQPHQPPHQPPRPHRPTTEERKHGQLWATSYYETPLSGRDQLQHMIAYVHDNPRRLLLKRQHSALFRPFSLTAAGIAFTAVGDAAILTRHPYRKAVRLSTRLSQSEILAEVKKHADMADNGVLMISPFVSPAEKAVMLKLQEEGQPYIRIDGNGFGQYYKPSGRECDLIAANMLLILAPWPCQEHPRHLGKAQFEALNAIARLLAAPQA